MSDDKIKTVPEALASLGEIYKERNKCYGDNYKRFGSVMELLFPQGIILSHPETFNVFGIFTQIVTKVMRIAENIENGHKDSLDDLSVYSQMMSELYSIKSKDSWDATDMLTSCEDKGFDFEGVVEFWNEKKYPAKFKHKLTDSSHIIIAPLFSASFVVDKYVYEVYSGDTKTIGGVNSIATHPTSKKLKEFRLVDSEYSGDSEWTK